MSAINSKIQNWLECHIMKTLSLSLALLCSVAAHAEPWRITYGTWGGFTGGGGGIELRSDGSLFATKAVVPSQEVHTYQGQVEPATLQQVHELAQKARCVDFREPANMTTSLKYYGDQQASYAWEIGRTDLPQPLLDWTQALQSIKAQPGVSPQWDGKPQNEASATLSLSDEKAATIKVTVGDDTQTFKGDAPASNPAQLEGRSVDGLTITKVSDWWLEGERDGLGFRLPLWVMR